MRRVLVLGGTGFVGRALCEKLVQRSGGGDARIVVPTRRAAHGNAVRSLPTVEVVQADVHDDATLARLVADSDAVVNLVAILHGSPAAFEQVHVALPRRLAALAGARRVVHISALGAAADAPSNYLLSKAAGEAALQPVQATLLRPSVIFGAEDRFMNLFAALQRHAPVLPLAGSGARFQPVWVEDVAAAIVQCLERPATRGQVFECAGPGTYTLAELARLAGRWSGHERPQIALPAALGWLQALLLEMLPGPPLMSRDNLRSMRVPSVASGLPGLQALGIVPAALEAIAPAYLGRDFARSRLNRWRSARG